MLTMEDNTQYKYYAFISYKSEDVKWAKWLQKKLERYSLPVEFQKKHDLPKKLSPVFRDDTDILPKELRKELNEKLQQSKYLIVLCSPRSARSKWVDDEVDQFCQMGKRDSVIALITEGTPYSNDPDTECYPPALKKWFPQGTSVKYDHQLLGADIHAAGPESNIYKQEKTLIQIIATILQLPFLPLWYRRRRQLLLETTGLLAITVGIVIAIFTTWLAGRPFNTEINLEEHTPHNASLPFKDGTLSLVANGDTLAARPLSNLNEMITISNIPGKFKGEEVHLIMNMFGYEPTDTILKLGTHHVLAIQRDSTFAIFSGHITHDDGTTPASKVKVRIEGKETDTNSDGYFKLTFPVSEQSTIKHVTISKEGYTTRGYDLQPQIDHSLVLLK